MGSVDFLDNESLLIDEAFAGRPEIVDINSDGYLDVLTRTADGFDVRLQDADGEIGDAILKSHDLRILDIAFGRL